jgi:hypothetical protein
VIAAAAEVAVVEVLVVAGLAAAVADAAGAAVEARGMATVAEALVMVAMVAISEAEAVTAMAGAMAAVVVGEKDNHGECTGWSGTLCSFHCRSRRLQKETTVRDTAADQAESRTGQIPVLRQATTLRCLLWDRSHSRGSRRHGQFRQ